ncbi:hypothetical protein B0H10DRAFT_2216736 [Mycena sp. CBHHK59/15]|nr:hypothetical protein B0H10DRAFT_2216736 [Mycena sp. CBHHK59/15]
MSTNRLSFPRILIDPKLSGGGIASLEPFFVLLYFSDVRESEEQWQKDQQKAARAAATRSKNGTTTGQKNAAASPTPATAAPTPFTPTTAQNRRAPLTSASHLSTQPTQAIPSIVQFPTHARTPATLVPDNYQPAYPDFGPLPGSGTHTSLNTSTAPSPSTFNAAHFQQMLERISPDHLAQMNTMLGTSLQPMDPGSGARLDLGYQGGQRGGWGSGNNYDFSSDRLGFPEGDRGSQADDEDSPAQDAPWNNQQADGASSGDEDHDGDGDVDMHNVNVQRRKRKHRFTQPDSDAEISPSAPTKKPRKKRENRRQKSRSIREVGDGDHRRVLEAAYPFIQQAVCLYTPWPLASPSRDPAADDDEFEALIDDAYDDAVERLTLDPCEFNSTNMSNEARNLLRARILQVRGCVMILVDKLVPACYGFIDIQSLSDPTPENIAVTEEANRQLVADLEGTFMYKDPTDSSDIATINRHGIFQKVLNGAFFAKKGINQRSFYFAGQELLPLETLGLFQDAIVCGIDRWKTGRYQIVDFGADTYRCIHEQSMEFLNAWVAEYELDVHPVNLAESIVEN